MYITTETIRTFIFGRTEIPANTSTNKKVNSIAGDRKRTNLLRHLEQPTIAFLCSVMPAWVTSDLLTFVGFLGSGIIAAGFVLAKADSNYLLLAVAGFAIQWFGDSLDGRLAYYRNSPRKWYGFSLDICIDWLSTILIGIGFYYFLPDTYKLLAFGFVTLYGWAMLLALLKYRVTDVYAVDTGRFGPTEFRIALCLVLLAELILPGALIVAGGIVIILLSITCATTFYSLLQAGNARDKTENARSIKH